MNQHTPGPWVVYPETDGTEIYAVDWEPGLPIRQFIARPARGDNWIANGRLIAAAPDLLAALKEVMGWINNWEPEFLQDDDWPAAAERARAAIAKATGGTPP